MVERKIVIGMIVSTDYLRQIHHVWNVRLLKSDMAKRLAMWCMEYYDKYNRAPVKDIEGIYFEKLKTLPKEVAEEIEQDILPGLSEEYIEEKVNLNYLLDQTFNYFKERHLLLHNEQIQLLVDKGRIDEAEHLACDYKLISTESRTDLDLSDEVVLKRIEKAFNETFQSVVRYGGDLGTFWNRQLIRGAFVALMGSSKRGKSYWLLDFAMRGCRQGAKVAFFQAGDMTEDGQLVRIATYLTRRSRYTTDCKEMYQPVRDCIFNQINTCIEEDRECDFGVFNGYTEADVRKKMDFAKLIQAYNDNKDYVVCRDACKKYKGAVWVEKLPPCNPLTLQQAKDEFDKYFIKNKRRFKLSTHIKSTLSVKRIRELLFMWEKQDNFVPDLIVVDYADLLTADGGVKEFRHKQDDIWGNLRGLSMEKHCLVVTATQADARSFERGLLKPGNFSEDKRKLDHVTSMYGLNQDVNDREKRIGLMRINELVKREGEFSNLNEVYVLQNLKRGRPFLESFL